MGEATEMKLKIHFGGSMKKDGEGYAYVGETGTKNVEWKIDEITWERFSLFCKEDSLIRAPIGLLWFKFEKEEMKDLRYAYDYLDEEMRILRSAGKLGVDVVEVFVEHIPNTEQDERSCSDEDEEVDRPKEDDEPEESEDENPTIQDIPAEIMTGNEAATGENQNENDDVGDELVVDAADGGSDSRFKSIFDEGMKAMPDKEAYREGINEEEKDDDSEDERAPVDVEYPDTPCACRRWDLTGIPCKHAKKAPRGPPLKVRKTTNIHHGVGTLWSPFTNRPFEVLGDRVYDRSDLNPQPPPQE
ncbi:hypothetical protein HID58_075863 [Brassica napus]|uniref:Zinc finger PMZ-type domain-containing protein n=1 Tax=Brassica napus TaxID=3708 RepID=A0ABQ7YP02_BRANA|nr:hypothetical protein HID58_075863 [Brassica napus]